MKKLLIMCALVTVFASMASAVTISAFCSPTANFANGAGSTDTTCPSFNTLNGGAPDITWLLTSVTLEYYGSISLGNTAGLNSVNLTYNPANVGTSGWAPDPTGPIAVSCTGIGCGEQLAGQPLTALATVPTFTNFANSFLVNLSSTLTNGAINNSDMSVRVVYDYTVQTSEIPEPSTYLMLSSGLLALGFGRRLIRRRP